MDIFSTMGHKSTPFHRSSLAKTLRWCQYKMMLCWHYPIHVVSSEKTTWHLFSGHFPPLKGKIWKCSIPSWHHVFMDPHQLRPSLRSHRGFGFCTKHEFMSNFVTFPISRQQNLTLFMFLTLPRPQNAFRLTSSHPYGPSSLGLQNSSMW